MSAAIAQIGHNNPPHTPFEVVQNSVDAVFEEAKHWLDGNPAQSQDDADAIAEILHLARQTEKDAASAKEAEKRPHLDANKEIEARFKPVLSRILAITSSCKQALAPWEADQEARRQAEAQAARDEAARKASAAQEAIRAAAGVVEREQAEALLRDAKRADAIATKAENAKSETKIGDRAVSLRTSYRAEVTDATEYARFVWGENHGELITFLEGLAQRQVNAGRRNLPGVTIREERSAV
jgi:hypothetical protein